jgi:hypothetical protein
MYSAARLAVSRTTRSPSSHPSPRRAFKRVPQRYILALADRARHLRFIAERVYNLIHCHRACRPSQGSITRLSGTRSWVSACKSTCSARSASRSAGCFACYVYTITRDIVLQMFPQPFAVVLSTSLSSTQLPLRSFLRRRSSRYLTSCLTAVSSNLVPY